MVQDALPHAALVMPLIAKTLNQVICVLVTQSMVMLMLSYGERVFVEGSCTQWRELGCLGAPGATAQQTKDVEGFMDRELGLGHTPAPIGHVQEILPRLSSAEVI